MKPAVDTLVFETVQSYRDWLSKLRVQQPGVEVGLVPTMGALHEGHATLIRRARQECQRVVVSIFVNPMQFGPNEDFDRYPRTFPNDLEICRAAGVDAVFHPSVQEVYARPLEEMTKVIPPNELIDKLCGAFRPGHFEGVATIVLKLFTMLQPAVAYFGEKDYQQLTVIRRMVEDLNVPVKIIGVPTVREADGLALSSRNVYLTGTEREVAPKLQQALQQVVQASESRAAVKQAVEAARSELYKVPNLTVQYLEVCDANSLQFLESFRKPFVVLVAAKLGNVRLIDNIVVR